MFFPERIKSIKSTDRVLEVGPGGTPHPRSDVLLEKNFDDDELRRQRGNTLPLTTDKEIVFYEGDRFPFKDKEFDYVICSHVLEHVPSDKLPSFCEELMRISNKGYIEFPTVYYEYLYNFDVHLNLMNLFDDKIFFLSKSETSLKEFKYINNFFLKTLESGRVEIVDSLKNYHFKGFEWFGNFEIIEVHGLENLLESSIDIPKVISEDRPPNIIQRFKNKISRIFIHD
jgi:predicted SAM-dependent methyltransferase